MAINCVSSSPIIKNCILTGNKNNSIYCTSSKSTFQNCVVIGNLNTGISLSNSDVTILNCTITGNYKGIYCDNSDAIITNCIVFNNIHYEISKDSDSSPIVSFCNIKGGFPGIFNIDKNPLFIRGGEFHLKPESPCIDAGKHEGFNITNDIDNEVRPKNSKYDIGADEFSLTPIVYGKIFKFPEDDYTTIQLTIDAATHGDIVIVSDGIYKGEGNTDINFNGKMITLQSENGPYNCVIDCEEKSSGFNFLSNEGSNSILSGFKIINAGTNYMAINCVSSSPIVKNCILTGNNNYSIYCKSSKSTIQNCIITGNLNTGISLSNSDVIILNCTVTGNSSSGIYCYDSNPNIINCIVYNNLYEITKNSNSLPTIKYCNINGSYPGLKNIDKDPLFASTLDFHLLENSPCINSGFSEIDVLPNLDGSDIDGLPRPQGEAYDIGAYEYEDNSTLKIYGQVSTTISGKPTMLSGAFVSLLETNIITVTDVKGKYYFSGIKIGSYTLKIEKYGFATKLINDIVVTDAHSAIVPTQDLTLEINGNYAEEYLDISSNFLRLNDDYNNLILKNVELSDNYNTLSNTYKTVTENLQGEYEETIENLTSEKNQIESEMNQEIKRLNSVIFSEKNKSRLLTDEYDSLTLSYSILSNMYNGLSDTHTELSLNFEELSHTHMFLSINNTNLSNTISLLTNQYQNLSNIYISLVFANNDLKQSYYELNDYIKEFDINNDRILGLPEAINVLRRLSNIK